MATSYTQGQLAALEAAFISAVAGPVRVEYEGRSVTYRTVAELKTALDDVRGQLTAGPARRSASFAGFSRGHI